MTRHHAILPAIAAAASLFTASAVAQTTDTSTSYSYKRPSPTTITTFGSLVDLCNTAPGSGSYDENHGVCVGYFSGFIDLYLAETPVASRVVCLPDPPITRQEARDKFMSFAGSHPDFMAQPASVGMYRFLTSTYPCTAASPVVAPAAPLAAPATR